jgi:hypothetical protein
MERGEGVPASDGAGGSGRLRAGGASASLAEASAEAGGAKPPGLSNDGAKLIARDDKKNPLISAFEWTSEAAQRILRVPAGFMRNKTQERIEEFARERDVACRAEAFGEGGKGIDLALVEEGIEMGKKLMTEMIATYSPPTSTSAQHNLNEVSPLTARSGEAPPKLA